MAIVRNADGTSRQVDRDHVINAPDRKEVTVLESLQWFQAFYTKKTDCMKLLERLQHRRTGDPVPGNGDAGMFVNVGTGIFAGSDVQKNLPALGVPPGQAATFQTAPLTHGLTVTSVGDMRTRTFPERTYDVILVEHALHHRQHTTKLLLRGQGLGARAGRLAADIDDVRPLGLHPHAGLDGAIDVVVQHAAVGEGVGRDVEDAHHESTGA
jgi:hypothetical protein